MARDGDSNDYGHGETRGEALAARRGGGGGHRSREALREARELLARELDEVRERERATRGELEAEVDELRAQVNQLSRRLQETLQGLAEAQHEQNGLAQELAERQDHVAELERAQEKLGQALQREQDRSEELLDALEHARLDGEEALRTGQGAANAKAEALERALRDERRRAAAERKSSAAALALALARLKDQAARAAKAEARDGENVRAAQDYRAAEMRLRAKLEHFESQVRALRRRATKQEHRNEAPEPQQDTAVPEEAHWPKHDQRPRPGTTKASFHLQTTSSKDVVERSHPRRVHKRDQGPTEVRGGREANELDSASASRIRKAEARCAHQEARIAGLEAEVERLEGEAADAFRNAVSSMHEDKESQASKDKESHASKDSYIDQLRDRIRVLEGKVKRRNATIRSQASLIQTLDASLDRMIAPVNSLRK